MENELKTTLKRITVVSKVSSSSTHSVEALDQVSDLSSSKDSQLTMVRNQELGFTVYLTISLNFHR
jgi:hypothetical protein